MALLEPGYELRSDIDPDGSDLEWDALDELVEETPGVLRGSGAACKRASPPAYGAGSRVELLDDETSVAEIGGYGVELYDLAGISGFDSLSIRLDHKMPETDGMVNHFQPHPVVQPGNRLKKRLLTLSDLHKLINKGPATG